MGRQADRAVDRAGGRAVGRAVLELSLPRRSGWLLRQHVFLMCGALYFVFMFTSICVLLLLLGRLSTFQVCCFACLVVSSGFGSFCFNLDWPKDVDDNLKHELKL